MTAPLALLALNVSVAVAGMTEPGFCLHDARFQCATIHVDANGQLVCAATGEKIELDGECEGERVEQESLRADDLEPEGLDAYARWRYASEPVSEDVLGSMSPEMLRVFRNTFFAGHGRLFKDRALDAFFRGFPWYKPRADFRESDLSAVEKANVAEAAAAEAALRHAEKKARAKGRRPAHGKFTPAKADSPRLTPGRP